MSSIIARRRHPAAGYAAVAGGLVAAGVLYARSPAAARRQQRLPQDSTQIAQGHSLFVQSCSSCHGLDAQGTAQAPRLIGAGAAAVDFQMSTGRMPAKELGAENDRKPTTFTQQQIYAIAAYIASLGGGPAIPARSRCPPTRRQHRARRGAVQHELRPVPRVRRRGRRADLRQERAVAQRVDAHPDLRGDADRPRGHAGLRRRDDHAAEKHDIIAYIIDTRNEANPGGFSLGRTGTVTEGLLAWIGGLGFLVLIAMWLTAKRRDRSR